MKLPASHPQRFELNNEVHARPPEPLVAPEGMLYLALLNGRQDWAQETENIASLCAQAAVAPPDATSNHFVASFPEFRLKWERHTEFSRYQLIFDIDPSAPFAESSLARLPTDWLEGLPGQLMIGMRLAFVPGPIEPGGLEQLSSRHFAGNVLVGSSVSGGAGIAITDFHIHEDGFGRLMLFNHGMTRWQAGRVMQRLIEVETYRMMALLTLPIARELSPFLAESRAALAELTNDLVRASNKEQPAVLERLMHLDAQIETRLASNQFRFSAAAAYYDLVRDRIGELREERMSGLQTFKEFTERRLAPAMSTCTSVWERLTALSERVARSSQLLSTRLAIARERQNQALLETMARRAKMQLRMQQTVEGLSVAAITYYIVGLIGYAAKALAVLGLPIKPELAIGIGIPVVAALVAFGVRGIRRRLGLEADRSA